MSLDATQAFPNPLSNRTDTYSIIADHDWRP